MRISKAFIPTLREAPSDADNVSAKLMLRAGMIRKVASGLYEWLPLGLRVLKKVEQIIREEMNSIDGQEVWMPIVVPKDLWIETGRWDVYGKELLRLKDRKDSEYCVAPTHEEVITDMVRRDVRSYRELPLMLYQFGTKFRDEIRPRFGIMRAREFLMKDAYSFHVDETDAEEYYHRVYEAYKRICERCGFDYRPVEAVTGAIGGSFSHEFMVLAETGEEAIASCECGYGANIEKAAYHDDAKIPKESDVALKDVVDLHTPDVRTIEEVGKFLKAKPKKFIKTLIYLADGKPVVALVRGDYELNEHKLQAVLGCSLLEMADEGTVTKVTGAPVGFAGPHTLKDSSVTIVADYSVLNIRNGISGANKADYHSVNLNINRDFKPTTVADIRNVIEGDWCPRCAKPMVFYRGIEVGHTFKLGTKYSASMGATYLNAEGKHVEMVMGCYGIGVSRIVAATIEQSHDDNGIIWPTPLAPYQVIIVPVNMTDDRTKEVAEKLYSDLCESGIEVIIDDRDERAGIKFKDADLMGIPLRVTVSEKTLIDDAVELKRRHEDVNRARRVPVTEICDELKKNLRDGK